MKFSKFLIALAAFLFSTGGAAIKACTLSGWQVASLRSGIAALVLFAYAPSSRKHWNGRTLLLAVAYAATLVLFVTANKLTTSANAIFLQSTGALYMLLLGPLVLQERIRGIDIVVIASVAAGAATSVHRQRRCWCHGDQSATRQHPCGRVWTHLGNHDHRPATPR